MKHLGGIGMAWIMLSGYSGPHIFVVYPWYVVVIT
jgi:hypothetical protein